MSIWTLAGQAAANKTAKKGDVMPATNMVSAAIESLLSESKFVAATRQGGSFQDLVAIEPLAKWEAGCRNLLRLLGNSGKPFQTVFDATDGDATWNNFVKMRGSLEAIEDAVKNGLLATVEELVFAEAFSDLIDQAEELVDKGYYLAAGVICRAVFEEHLRKLCELHGCLPDGKPMNEALKQSLVKAGVLTKIDAKNADAIAGEGNHCAHNMQPPLDEIAVRGLIQKTVSFLAQHPLK